MLRPQSGYSPRHVVTSVLLVAACLLTTIAEACMSTPPPRCARTLVVATSGPPVLLAPAGAAVNFELSAVVFFRLLEAPPGACPPVHRAGPEMAELVVSVDAVCSDGAGGGTLGPVTIAGGYTDIVIPVTLDAGGARICTLNTTATAALPDGSSLTANSDNNVCVGEPAPTMPDLPRLDIRVSGGASNTARVHPGDQASFSYVITNNDPTESYSGKMAVSLVNVSRQPGFTHGRTGDAVDGAYSVSDPVQGDNFPLGFTEDLVNGCLYIPQDHSNPEPSRLNKFIDLEPGESTKVDVYARPFAQCGNGSCSVSTLVLDGQFSDTSEGLACAGFVVVTDTSVAPEFAWAQGGATGIMQTPPAPFVMDFILRPQAGQTLPMFLVRGAESLSIDGSLASSQPVPSAFTPGDDRGRFVATAGEAGSPLLPTGSTFRFENVFELSPDAIVAVDVLQVRPTAPTGSETTGPGAIVSAGLRDLASTSYDGFVDVTIQVSGDSFFSDGSFQRLQIDGLDITPGPFPTTYTVVASGPLPQPVGAEVLEQLTIFQDVQTFGRPNADFDLDTVTDDLDNCTLIANPGQADTDADGFGNACDPDLNQDNIVNFVDLNRLKEAFFSTPADAAWNPDADFDSDDSVNFNDLNRMKNFFFGTPGPSPPR